VFPQTLVALAFALALLATLHGVAYVGGAAYAMSFSPAFLARNLATYLRWCVALGDPARDAVAAVEPGALAVGIAIAAGIAALLHTQRRDDTHPEEIGAVWFLALLAPVLPLTGHTYLYYLYAPWAGACWLVAGAGRRAARRWPSRATGALLAIALLAFVGLELRSVRTREGASVHGLPLDRTMRESLLLRNAIAGLRGAGLAPRDSIAFVNPLSPRHQNIASRDTALHAEPTQGATYTPLEAALRGGESVRLFFPGVKLLGFAESVPPTWETAALFFYDNDGTLTPLGRGLEAQQKLGALMLRIRRWELAEPTFRRMIVLGDTSADAAHGLLVALVGLDRNDKAERLAAAFVKRWPRDPRSAVIEEALRRSAR
jgi:hypothetical protein